MTHLTIEHALLAVLAARGGDDVSAAAHILRAQTQTRATARRERQLVEIAALVVTDDRARAAGLALEHLVEFPDDAELLGRISPAGAARPSSGLPVRPPASRAADPNDVASSVTLRSAPAGRMDGERSAG